MDKFVDRAKEAVFYEQEGGNDDVRLMLSGGEYASRVNEMMARVTMAGCGVFSCFKGRWKERFAGFGEDLERMYLNLNGYSRVQAIEMRGASTIAEREVLAKKQRGGLLGLFSKGE